MKPLSHDELAEIRGDMSRIIPLMPSVRVVRGMLATIDHLVELLGQLEWSATSWARGVQSSACPICNAKIGQGHTPNCELAAALKLVDVPSIRCPHCRYLRINGKARHKKGCELAATLKLTEKGAR